MDTRLVIRSISMGDLGCGMGEAVSAAEVEIEELLLPVEQDVTTEEVVDDATKLVNTEDVTRFRKAGWNKA